jgi:hypothetical protein
MPTRLETLANILIAVTCLVVIAVGVERLVQRWNSPGGRRPIATPANSALLVPGRQVSGLPEVQFSAADGTLVLYISPRCRFCAQSLAFYRRIAESKTATRRRLRIVAVGRESLADLRQFIDEGHVAVDQLLSAGDGRMPPSTPTVVLVDTKGVIIASWVGWQSSQGEESVLRTLARVVS